MKNRIRKGIKLITIFCILLSAIIAYSNVLVSWAAADSELTITPKPETNNMHLKWTGPLNSTYRVFQKKPGSNHFETIGLTDFSNTDEEVKVLNVYPTRESVVSEILITEQPFVIPNISVTYLDRN